MFVTYIPEGSEAQTWEFLPRRVRVSEVVIVERQYGGTWLEFVTACKAGEGAARQILLWHLIRRDGHVLSFRDTPDFMESELLIEQSAAELEENYDAWIATGGAGREDGELLQTMFSAAIEKAREREGVGTPGKAPSETSPTTTSGP